MDNRLTRTGAVFSPCGRYRYKLWRVWDPDLPLGCHVPDAQPVHGHGRRG